MTKIYIVTKGSYSDYHIKGVFSSQQLADDASEAWTDHYDPCSVEVFDLDAIPQHPPGLLPYEVLMQSNGDTVHVHRCSVDDKDEDTRYGDQTTNRVFYMFASNETHAIKIANERRLILLANGTW